MTFPVLEQSLNTMEQELEALTGKSTYVVHSTLTRTSRQVRTSTRTSSFVSLVECKVTVSKSYVTRKG